MPSASARAGVRALVRVAVACVAAVTLVVATPHVAPVRAITGGEATSATFTCSSVTVSHNALVFDRDNTGLGRERYRVLVTDGSANILYDTTITRDLGDFIIGASVPVSYDASPVSNPIRLTLVSIAGNGYAEQVVWDEIGSCAFPNQPPVVLSPSYTVQRDATLTGALSDRVTDPEGDALSYALGSLAGTLGVVTLDPAGAFTYTPAVTGAATDSFPFTVSDGTAAPVSGVVTITITEPPAPPAPAPAADPTLAATGVTHAAQIFAVGAVLLALGVLGLAWRARRPEASR